jgi:hypothetical protein
MHAFMILNPSLREDYEEMSLISKHIFELLLRSGKKIIVQALIKFLESELHYNDKASAIYCIAVSLSLLDMSLFKQRTLLYCDKNSDEKNSKLSLKEIFAILIKDVGLEYSYTTHEMVEMNVRYLHGLKKLLDGIDNLCLIQSTGLELTKDEIVNKYSLSEREYKKFRILFSQVTLSLSLIKLGKSELVIPKLRIAIRKNQRLFKLNDENYKKIHHFSSLLKEYDEVTLNRVVRDFFTLYEQQQRLLKRKQKI